MDAVPVIVFYVVLYGGGFLLFLWALSLTVRVVRKAWKGSTPVPATLAPTPQGRTRVEIPFTEEEERASGGGDFLADKGHQDRLVRELHTGPVLLDTFDRRDAARSLQVRGRIEVHRHGDAIVALLTDKGRAQALTIWAAFEAWRRKHLDERHDDYVNGCLVCDEELKERGRRILARTTTPEDDAILARRRSKDD